MKQKIKSYLKRIFEVPPPPAQHFTEAEVREIIKSHLPGLHLHRDPERKKPEENVYDPFLDK